MALPDIKVRVTADTDQAEAGLDRVTDGMKEADRAANRMSRGLGAGAGQLKNYGVAAKSGAMHTANLTAQFNDIGVMLASGQSPLLLAMQQGTQVNQVFAQMGGTGRQAIGGVIQGLRSMVSPLNLATIGIIAGGAALVQWGISALQADEDANALEERLERMRENSDALNESLRGLRLGVGEDELAVMDAIAEAQVRVQEAQERVNTERGHALRNARAELANAQEHLGTLEAQLATIRSQQSEQSVLSSEVARTANQERMLGEQMAQTAVQQREAQAMAALLRDGISASVVQAMQLAGINLAAGISPAANEAARLADNLGIAFSRALAIVNMSSTPMMTDEDAVMGQAVVSGPATSRFGRDDLLNMGYTDQFLQTRGIFAPVGTGGGGGGGGAGGGAVAQRNPAIQALIDSLKTEDELLQEWYEESQANLAEANAQELEIIGGHNEAKLRLEEEYQRRLSDLRTGYNGDGLEQAKTFFSDMESAMQSGSEGMLRIAKAFGAAQSLINAYQAYTEVLKDPTLPWFARIPAAVGVLSAGIGMVNAIKGVSPGASSAGAATGAAAAPAAAQQAQTSQQVSNFNVVIEGQSISTSQFGGLIDQINEEARNGGRIFIRAIEG